MDYRLKCKTCYCKTPRGKHRRKLHDIGLDDNLLNITPKAQKTVVKIDKWDFKQKVSAQQRKQSNK